MSGPVRTGLVPRLLDGLPLLFLLLVMALFASLSPRFLAPDNLAAIIVQSSWLAVLALGVTVVLLTAGVDLSIGATMYVAAVTIGLLLPGQPVWLWPVLAIAVGMLVGLANALLVTRARLPPFIATLAMAFVARGAGLFMSSTAMVVADPAVADFGRAGGSWSGGPLLLALPALGLGWLLLHRTTFGLFTRAIGADAKGAARAGIPTRRVLVAAYLLCGACAGLAGFISFSQTGAATAAFGLNAEFLAIAAAVLGGTSLFGGRGNAFAPLLGAVLIMTVQNGLVLVDANPYAYPVVTGGVILAAALLDGLRARLLARAERPRILAPPGRAAGGGALPAGDEA